MLTAENGNCVDTAHLVNALARSIGIQARYAHAECQFKDGVFDHVWSELYINGEWITADASKDYNSLGDQQTPPVSSISYTSSFN